MNGTETMQLIGETQVLQDVLNRDRAHGLRVGFVPTMGYLHDGHAALIRRAAELSQRVVVSVFVNPLQFGPAEDYGRYPRDIERDKAVAHSAGAAYVYAPEAGSLTPETMRIAVDPGPLADTLCGASRPGHFRGVCTIVAKLFNIVQPHAAVFGWKDAQQFIILRKMVEDLDFPVVMEGLETVREPDGLAMSSRNTYLAEQQRREAPALCRALQKARDAALAQGELAMPKLVGMVREEIETTTSARIDYVSGVSMTDLHPLERVQPGNTMIALAAFFGKTRLIDNVRF